jgi:hypothetical protein
MTPPSAGRVIRIALIVNACKAPSGFGGAGWIAYLKEYADS